MEWRRTASSCRRHFRASGRACGSRPPAKLVEVLTPSPSVRTRVALVRPLQQLRDATRVRWPFPELEAPPRHRRFEAGDGRGEGRAADRCAPRRPAARRLSPAFRIEPDEVGFMRLRSHDIVAIDVCPLFAPAMASGTAAQTLARDLRGLARPLDVGVTATLDGLDVDLRGSGPLDLAEARNWRERRRRSTWRYFQSRRETRPAACAAGRLRRRVRHAAARRFSAGDRGGRNPPHGIRYAGARRCEEGCRPFPAPAPSRFVSRA